MSKVLFTHSFVLKYDAKQLKRAQVYPPLATLYAASFLRDAGYDVSLHDNMFSSTAKEVVKLINELKPEYFIIYDDGFNYLTKMCLTNMRQIAFEMIKHAKISNCKVIVSSSDATDHKEMYLNQGADYIILGEAENTLLELLNGLENNLSVSEIHGLAYLDNDQYRQTRPRSVMRELDRLPFPAWDLIDMTAYKNIWLKNHAYFSLNLVTTRGCPYKCNWCAKPIYGNKYNAHSPEYISDQLEILLNKYGAQNIWFSDDIFGLKPGWIERLAELVKEKQLRFNYYIQCRADLLVKEETVKALALSGCSEIWMGVESGSQKILDKMDKGITVEQVYQATKLLKKYNIRSAFFLQFGYLGETLEDIELTLKLLFDLMPDDIGVSVSYPLPGTPFYDTVKSLMGEKTNWSDSDELDMMFHNTYSSDFYKALHTYVHKTFRKKQAIQSLKKAFTKPSILLNGGFKGSLSALYYIPASWLAKTKFNKFKQTKL